MWRPRYSLSQTVTVSCTTRDFCALFFRQTPVKRVSGLPSFDAQAVQAPSLGTTRRRFQSKWPVGSPTCLSSRLIQPGNWTRTEGTCKKSTSTRSWSTATSRITSVTFRRCRSKRCGVAASSCATTCQLSGPERQRLSLICRPDHFSVQRGPCSSAPRCAIAIATRVGPLLPRSHPSSTSPSRLRSSRRSPLPASLPPERRPLTYHPGRRSCWRHQRCTLRMRRCRRRYLLRRHLCRPLHPCRLPRPRRSWRPRRPLRRCHPCRFHHLVRILNLSHLQSLRRARAQQRRPWRTHRYHRR